MWEIRGTDEFETWFYKELHPRERAELDAKINLLAERGPLLGRPHVDTLAGTRTANLKELRAHTDRAELRVIFVFDPTRAAILLLGGNKTGTWQRWYRWAIPRAEALYHEHLRDLREGGKT